MSLKTIAANYATAVEDAARIAAADSEQFAIDDVCALVLEEASGWFAQLALKVPYLKAGERENLVYVRTQRTECGYLYGCGAANGANLELTLTLPVRSYYPNSDDKSLKEDFSEDGLARLSDAVVQAKDPELPSLTITTQQNRNELAVVLSLSVPIAQPDA